MVPQITSLRFANYRAFGNEQTMTFRPLNFFFGRNGSGKTTIVRAPSLLVRGLQGGPGSLSQILAGNDRDENAMELIHGVGVGTVSLGLDLLSDNTRAAWDVKILGLPGTQRTGMRPSMSIESWSWKDLQSGETTWFTAEPDPGLQSGQGMGKSQNFRRFRRIPTQHGLIDDGVSSIFWQGLFPLGSFTLPPRSMDLLALRAISLGATRPVSPRISAIPSQEVQDFSTDGSQVADLLAADMIFRDGELARQTSAWYETHLGWKLELELNARQNGPNEGSYSIGLMRPSTNLRIPLASHGSGMQQVLPVVVRCMAALLRPAEASIYAFEEPETHLHPAAHAALADLFIKTALEQPVPILVETHSEMMLLRLRRRVAEGLVRPEDVALFWIDDDHTPQRLQQLMMEPDGWVDDWPRGVFSEDAEEVRAITRAARKQSEGVS